MRISRFVSLALAVGLIGCIPQQDNELHPVARAIPTADQVKIQLPDRAATRTVGQLAPWYVATREVTRSLNGGTGWVLVVVHAIVQFPPTETSGNVATWGPWSDALDPAEYRLVVTALADGSYDWALDGRSKTVAGATFETVIAGNAVPSNPEGTGSGRFTIDFDAGERVNPIDNDASGVVSVIYDLDARTLDMTVSTVEDRLGTPTPIDYHYTYAEAIDGSGDMSFATHGDTDDAGPLAEDAVLRSRWLATGSGRADVRLSSGDLGDLVVTGSECWDTNFRRSYYSDSANFMPTEGDASTCAYADMDLPSL